MVIQCGATTYQNVATALIQELKRESSDPDGQKSVDNDKDEKNA